MIEIAVLTVALVGVVVLARLVRLLEPFIVNAVAGLAILWLAVALFNVEVAVTPVTLLVVAIAGIVGAFAVLLLALLELAFVPALY